MKNVNHTSVYFEPAEGLLSCNEFVKQNVTSLAGHLTYTLPLTTLFVKSIIRDKKYFHG